MDTVLLAVLRHDASDLSWMKRAAQAVLPSHAHVPDGRSASRILEFYAGRAAIAYAFAHLGIQSTIEPDPDLGFLTAPGAKGRFVNLTHTTGIAVAAVAGATVGVDVESLTRDTSRVIARVSTAEELSRIAGLRLSADRTAIPGGVALWSAKESVSKATGLGIKFGMRHFVVALDRPSPHPVTLGVSGPLALIHPAVAFRVEAGFVLSICSEMDEIRKGFDLLQVPRPRA